VLLGVVGSALTAQNDASSSSASNHGQDNDDQDDIGNAQRKLLGDVLGLISAVGYGTYAVQTRVLCPPDETLYSMQTLLGYIGLLNMVVLSPIAIYTVLSGTSHLGWVVVGFLVVKGLFDNVLSDYLWLRAVMLTNATTATVGLGLTIPLAFASDLLMGNNTNGNATISATQVCGALAVLFGFVLVNLGNTNGAPATESALQSTHENDDRTDETGHPTNFTDAAPSETEFVDSIPVMS
jgi:solute carrier family 35, member F5